MILADHCVYLRTVRRLRTVGFSVTRLEELARRDAPDSEVLEWAIQHDLVLLTTDHDFGNILLYPPSQHAGVILMKITPQTENQVHEVLLQMLGRWSREELRHKLVVVDGKKYRIRS